MVELESLRVSSSLPRETSLVRVLSKRNLEVVFPKKSLSAVQKSALTDCSPKPLTVYNKKLEGLENSGLKNLKNLF
jgi:hypothetical protein